MAIVQFYSDDGEARLFEDELIITLDHPKRKLHRRESTTIFRQLGFRLKKKWIKTEWGWEAKFNRIRKEAP